MSHEKRARQRLRTVVGNPGIPRGLIDDRRSRPVGLHWPAWLALIERKRRLLCRKQGALHAPPPAEYFTLATRSSFRLEEMDVSESELHEARAHAAAQRRFRSRTCQRLRNHIAILHHIEAALQLGQPLKTSTVLRWYTSISCGLSTNELGAEKMGRLESVVRRINSPQLRLQPAIQEIARTHLQLLNDPLMPSFNGILSRLLLRYHLGRCNLPFAVFPETVHPQELTVETTLLLRLLTAVDQSYDRLLNQI